MVAGALRRPGLAPPDGFEWIPPVRTWSNYSFANDIVPLGDYALNSLLVVVVAVPLTVLIASWAGFAIAIATAEPATRKRLVVISVLALMCPSARCGSRGPRSSTRPESSTRHSF